MALVHHPVLNKNGDIIASAVTNLDLHDIARAAKTFGVKAFYVITPLIDQMELVSKIIDHWVNGAGAKYNPKRRQALELVRVRASYSEAVDEIIYAESCVPVTVATTARSGFLCVQHEIFKKMMISSLEPYMLVFGTAWGLSDSFLCSADYILGSIRGSGNYNHLSVRSAVSIVLDRFFGC